MTTNIFIRRSIPQDCYLLFKTLRESDKLEASRVGCHPRSAILDCYNKAFWRKTALIDGKVAAMWGLGGTPMGNKGHPYLMTGSECEKISPIKFAKIYKKEVEVMKSLFPILENYVDMKYTGAVGMLRIAGFTLESKPISINGNHFLKFSMVN